MNTYRLRVRPIQRLTRTGWNTPGLSSEPLIGQLTEGSLRELSSEDSYHWLIVVKMTRETHEQAVDELLLAVQRLGFEVVNAWADRAVEGAFLGLAGGGTAGSGSGMPILRP